MNGVPAAATSVSKRIKGRSVLRDASLAVRCGQILGLVGPNGAGKTTLLRVLLGLIRPDGGSVTLAGRPVAVALRHSRVVYTAGSATLPPSVRVRQWARLFGATVPAAHQHRRLGALSHGQRQLVALRIALSPDELDLIVLDEPWDGLDAKGADWLTQRLLRCRDGGTTVIVASHRLVLLAELCDECAVMFDGHVDAINVVRKTADGRGDARRLREAYRIITERGALS